MDKQKQIEEMTQSVAINGALSCNGKILGMSCGECKYRPCVRYFRAEEVYNEGYRKITDEVVLTGTETEERLVDLLVDFDEMSFYPATTVPNPDEYAREWKRKLIYIIGQLRKETAEKFAEMLKKQFMGVREYQYRDTGTAWGEPCIGGFINDKIDKKCKEFTEGEV